MDRKIQTVVSLIMIAHGLAFFTVYVVRAHIYNIHNNWMWGIWFAGAFLIIVGALCYPENKVAKYIKE